MENSRQRSASSLEIESQRERVVSRHTPQLRRNHTAKCQAYDRANPDTQSNG